MTSAPGEPKVSRRLVLGAIPFLGGCSIAQDPAPSTSSSAGTGTAQPHLTPARDPGWVRTENERPGDQAWRLEKVARNAELGAFCDRVSVLPGESVGLRVSSVLGPVTISAHRLGWYAGSRAREVWRSTEPVAAAEQPKPVKDRFDVVGTHWAETLKVDTTGWPEGSYVFKIAAGGKSCWTPLTVRTADPRGRLVLINAVTTWQAYNQWGGHSLYKGPDGSFGTRSRGVSFDRPYNSNGASRLMREEAPTIALAESLGLDLAYTTSVDVHADPASILGARGVVTLGHDEYWTVPTRRAVEQARDTGSNLAFLGANACYWRVRMEDSELGRHRRVVCFKSAAEDPKKGADDTTDLWRRRPEADPENTLTGMLYEAFPAQGPMVVHDSSHFLLEGTGAKAGDRFPGLVGIEIDRAYPVQGTPESLQVVMHSPVAAPGGRGTTHSDLTYYTASSGAGVVSTGSMVFSRSFDGPLAEHGITADSVAFARALTTTLLTEMAKGPVGKRHPAKPNLAELHASRNTSTGTGFAVDWDHLVAART